MKKYFIIVSLTSIFVLSCASPPSKKSEAVVNRISFPSGKEALVYVLERRLQIQRLYENSSEPYFGKPQEKDCRKNVDLDGKLQHESWGSFLYLKILVNDHLAIGDCLIENNSKRALYEFYICKNEVVELRSYVGINAELPNAPTMSCEH